MFRQRELAYSQRRKDYSKRFERPKLSPSERQTCHSSDDKAVTQTSPTNNIQSTYSAVAAAVASNEQRAASEEATLRNRARTSIGLVKGLPRYLGPASSQEVAEISAERRWNNALIDRFGTGPAYAVLVEALDATLQDAATKAETTRSGAGIVCILQEVARRGIRL